MISVCIATHNGGKYIKEQLESILAQLSDEDEIIISDDGSTDNTLKEIEALNDQRIKIHHLKHMSVGKKPHYYTAHNFENALSYARGDIIFLSDQDDVWYPDKVTECMKILNTHTAVLHNLECVDGSLNTLNKLWYNENLRFRPYNIFMKKGKHMGCAMAFRREVLDVAMPFPKDLKIHDYWLGIIAELTGDLHYLERPLIKYRIHGNNVSGTNQIKNSFIDKVLYRLYTIANFIVRVSIRNIR